MMHTFGQSGRPLLLSVVIFLVFFCSSTIAATHIYVQNDTNHELTVSKIELSGHSLSSKAWKKGKAVISPNSRESVLAINRTGKFNWMDPTPRFVEPGKTVVFSVIVNLSKGENNKPVSLRQKLLGTGSGSKMWYSISGVENTFDWELELNEYDGVWKPSDSNNVQFRYRAFKDDEDTHVEYIFLSES